MHLWQLTALEATDRIRSGRISSEDLVKACLDRISETDGTIRAWAHVDADQALSQARAMDEMRKTGKPLGALHGIPVGLKDIIDTAGMPTECGTPIHKDRRPESDATLVNRLREAGAVIMGKTVTTELAFVHAAATVNPHNNERTPGGSSSGSAAAVAAGQVPLAVGSQTNGSVIRPASYCGIYGFKPTRGNISRAGVLQTSKTLDQMGVFARSLADAAALADALTGHDPADDATHTRPKPVALAGATALPEVDPCFAWFDLPYADRLSEDTRLGLSEVAESLGATVETLPAPKAFMTVVESHKIVHEYEFIQHRHEEIDRHWDALSDTLKAVIEHARTYSDAQYEDAMALMEGAREFFHAFFMDYNAILAPAATGEAPMLGEGTGDPICSTIWTFAGLPCLTLPLLEGASGLPIGVQLIGSWEEDDRLMSSANWLQHHLQADAEADLETNDMETA